MKKTILSIATLAGLTMAGAATAQDVDFNTVDANDDGVVSFEELQAVLPNLAEEDFAALDTTGTGDLTEEEFSVLFNAPADSDAAPADPMAPADPGAEPMEPAM